MNFIQLNYIYIVETSNIGVKCVMRTEVSQEFGHGPSNEEWR